MIGALRSYRELTTSLWLARLEAGGTLSQDDELKFTSALCRAWDAMTDEERDEAEKDMKRVPTVGSEPEETLDVPVALGATTRPRKKP